MKVADDPLSIQMMPRDVTTRWNSTFEMLVFALEYHEAIDEILGNKEMRKYELKEEEWALVKQLCNVLEVRCSSLVSMSVTHVFLDVQRCDPILFTLNAKPCHHDPCHGSH